jgi:threonylcarbamoyladenosine tRNA methylthiotransferase MtaB
MSKRVAFYTLGCKLNFSETSTISRSFQEKGYQKVEFHESPDIYVINTCSVTENADRKCRKVVRDALAISPNAFIAIIGCYAQLKPKEISEIPGVDAVLGASEKFQLLELIDDFEKSDKAVIHACEIQEAKDFYTAWSINDRTRTFLKVQDGCNYNCTFCTIPLARGKSRSDTIENIVKAAERIASSGIREIVLTGVNTGDYGIIDGKRKSSFLELIRELDKVDGIDRFRISSIEPNLLTNEIIHFVSCSERFVPHFHIPLQSGNDKLLKLMRRRYERALYTDRVNRIRSTMPDACIGVDVIVGFPGETEEDFLMTYNYLNELDISYLHVFTYSERPNTEAVELPGAVPQKVRAERSRMLRILSEKKRRAFYEKHLGETRTVLIENDVKDGIMHGFTDNYIRVAYPYEPELVNQMVELKLEEMDPQNLVQGILKDGFFVNS